MYTQQQFDKLPKWAQQEIKKLQNNNKSLTDELSQVNGESETNTYLSDGLDKKPMPKNSHVDFHVGERNEHTVRVFVRSDGSVDINKDSRTGKITTIIPRAANSFYVAFVDGY